MLELYLHSPCCLDKLFSQASFPQSHNAMLNLALRQKQKQITSLLKRSEEKVDANPAAAAAPVMTKRFSLLRDSLHFCRICSPLERGSAFAQQLRATERRADILEIITMNGEL